MKLGFHFQICRDSFDEKCRAAATIHFYSLS